MPKPSVGRIVHYTAYGTPGGEYPAGICRAAVVTEVNDATPEIVGLVALNPTGQFFLRGCHQSEEAHLPGSWHWPERVE